MKKFILVAVSLLVIVSGGLYWWFGVFYITPTISKIDLLKNQAIVGAHNQTIIAEVVRTNADRTRGLGGRAGIGINDGMLFLFERQGDYGFWMKDMHFPIDIVWIASSRVVRVDTNVPAPSNVNVPDDSLPVYHPPAPVDMVLELHAGRAAILGLKTGDALSIKPLLPHSRILSR